MSRLDYANAFVTVWHEELFELLGKLDFLEKIFE